MEIEDGDAAKLMIEDGGPKQLWINVTCVITNYLLLISEYAAQEADNALASAHCDPSDQVWAVFSEYIWNAVI
jgi:hypothetical protein